MRQPETYTYDDEYRSSSPNNQLPSLQEQLLRHRQDDHNAFGRPSLRTNTSDFLPSAEPWATSQPAIESLIPGTCDFVPPSEPSPSWFDDSSIFSDPRASEPDPKRKRPRFLGDIDRRIIIQRLENGEKQADLAREFGVTRAAICHINKNRDEILTRFDILAKSPQGRQMIENYVHTPHVLSLVRELRTANVLVLLTRLRDNNTSPAVFKSTADRLMSILIEEALVSFGTKPVGVQDLLGSYYQGKEYVRPTCALSVGDDGKPMLNVFTTMEPAGYCGFILSDQQEKGRPVRHVDLVPGATEANVLVCLTRLDEDASVDGVLQALEGHGISVNRVCVVCVTASDVAVNQLAKQYRDARVVTASITCGPLDRGLENFASRWAASTLGHQ